MQWAFGFQQGLEALEYVVALVQERVGKCVEQEKATCSRPCNPAAVKASKSGIA